jgi:hypothetical protein
MRERLDPGHQFLWTDESPERSARLRRDEILIEPMTGPGPRHVPDGLIHHWVGALFIPHTTLENVLAVVRVLEQNLGHYSDLLLERGRSDQY